MKTILAYGDSLTRAYDAATGGGLHAFEDRWPTRLEAGLGGKARVIAEGLNGRTTAFDDHLANADRNGARILPTILASHAPLDLVIVMLGTNDLKAAIHGSALTASYGIRRLLQIVHAAFVEPGAVVPKGLVVSPPHLCDTQNVETAIHFGGANTIEQSRQFATLYKARAEEYGAAFFDASTVARPDPIDGVHLDAENTRAIGDALAPLVKDLLGL